MQIIERQALKTMMDRGDDFALVEVLGAGQYRKLHLPGAINVPLGNGFEKRIQQALPDKSRTIVVYCSDADCEASPTAARKMEQLGYEHVFDYAAGKADWKDAGLPIEGEGREALEQSAAQ